MGQMAHNRQRRMPLCANSSTALSSLRSSRGFAATSERTLAPYGSS
jgi:hypothetical protein